MTEQYKKIHKHNYSSLSELMEKGAEPADHMSDMERSSRRFDRDSWAATSWPEAVQFATYGWEEGFKEITELTKKHKHIFDDLFPKQDFAKQIIMEVEGESPDVGLALQGVPESMVTFREEETSKIIPGNKLQRVIYQNSFSACIDKKTCFNYGAMICCMINAMELHGFRTEIICRSSVSSSSYNQISELATYDTVIKKFDQSPDYNTLAFCLASAAYLRRAIFAVHEQHSPEFLSLFSIKPDMGYGYPKEYKDDLVEATDIYIPYIKDNNNFETIAMNFRSLVEEHFRESTKQKQQEQGLI